MGSQRAKLSAALTFAHGSLANHSTGGGKGWKSDLEGLVSGSFLFFAVCRVARYGKNKGHSWNRGKMWGDCEQGPCLIAGFFGLSTGQVSPSAATRGGGTCCLACLLSHMRRSPFQAEFWLRKGVRALPVREGAMFLTPESASGCCLRALKCPGNTSAAVEEAELQLAELKAKACDALHKARSMDGAEETEGVRICTPLRVMYPLEGHAV